MSETSVQPVWTHLSGNGCKLHVTHWGSTLWSEQPLFRDYPRRHPEAGSAYEQLKLRGAVAAWRRIVFRGS